MPVGPLRPTAGVSDVRAVAEGTPCVRSNGGAERSGSASVGRGCCSLAGNPDLNCESGDGFVATEDGAVCARAFCAGVFCGDTASGQNKEGKEKTRAETRRHSGVLLP